MFIIRLNVFNSSPSWPCYILHAHGRCHRMYAVFFLFLNLHPHIGRTRQHAYGLDFFGIDISSHWLQLQRNEMYINLQGPLYLLLWYYSRDRVKAKNDCSHFHQSSSIIRPSYNRIIHEIYTKRSSIVPPWLFKIHLPTGSASSSSSLLFALDLHCRNFPYCSVPPFQ